MDTSVSVTKEFTFDCCHLLSDHPGKCKNLHGHTYKVQVTVMSKQSFRSDTFPRGIIVDFKDLKERLNADLFDQFDHAYIYNSLGGAAERQIGTLIHSFKLRSVDLKMPATAENMAHYFFEKAQEILQASRLIVLNVKVWETPTSFAEATKC